jgi:hypothetical protein
MKNALRRVCRGQTATIHVMKEPARRRARQRTNWL